MAKPVKEKKEEKAPTTNDIFASAIEANKENILNDIEQKDFRLSFGSLILDRELEGLSPGLTRFIGVNEGGKTSEALLCLKNFFKMFANSRGLYIKAEGKLPPIIQERSGIKFVKKIEDWVDGTCFILESNVTSTIEDIMKKLVRNNVENKRFFFILDSVDGLVTPDQIEKDTRKGNKAEENQNERPAGIASFCNDLLKKINNRLTLEGHIAIFISQCRSDLRMQYTKKEQAQGTSKNGHAIQHYANWAIQYESKVGEDLIKEKEGEKPGPGNDILGHWAKITVVKSPNEKTGRILRYPIRYGRTGGNSIWIEREICEILRADGYFKGTSWLEIEPNFAEELKSAGLEVTLEGKENNKVQGEKNLLLWLEENPAITAYLFEKFRKSPQE